MLKYATLIVNSFIILSCSQNSSVNEDKLNSCDCGELSRDENLDIWMYDNTPYTGECETFYENGTRESYSTFNKGKIHGTLLTFYKNGEIEESVDYDNGKLQGKVIYYYQNGDTSEFGSEVNGMKSGKWIGFHENGNLMYEQNWQNDLLSDSAFDYFEDGTLETKGFFIQGKAEGIWTFYDSLTGEIDGYLEFNNDSVIRKFN